MKNPISKALRQRFLTRLIVPWLRGWEDWARETASRKDMEWTKATQAQVMNILETLRDEAENDYLEE
jgi:hypothetical protein